MYVIYTTITILYMMSEFLCEFLTTTVTPIMYMIYISSLSKITNILSETGTLSYFTDPTTSQFILYPFTIFSSFSIHFHSLLEMFLSFTAPQLKNITLTFMTYMTSIYNNYPILFYTTYFIIPLIFGYYLHKFTTKNPILSFISTANKNKTVNDRINKKWREYWRSTAFHMTKNKYPIILDCGATFTMSGDKDLFISSSLIKLKQPEIIGLAESGMTSTATHVGKMIIDGRNLDAFYCPQFHQTMVSMGQLERLGLIYNKQNDTTRNFLTNTGEIYLSFHFTQNNLYQLTPISHQSVSATKTA